MVTCTPARIKAAAMSAWHVGKAKHAIGLQGQNFVNLGVEKSADAGFFFTRPPGSHGEPEMPTMRASSPVQPLGGLFGHAGCAEERAGN